MNEDWWEPYVPKAGESYQDYLRRATAFDLEFVMMKHEPRDLYVIGHAQKLLATRHVHVPGKYVVFVIRDLVFLAYTADWEEDEW